MKANSFTRSHVTPIRSMRTTDWHDGWSVEIEQDGTIGWSVRDNNGNYAPTDESGFIGDWVHVAAIFDGRQPVNSNRIKLYIDGQEKSLDLTGNILPALIDSANYDMRIGNNYPGLIDDVRIYNYALDVAEINALPGFVSVCPNGFCEFDEDSLSCPADCPGTTSAHFVWTFP